MDRAERLAQVAGELTPRERHAMQAALMTAAGISEPSERAAVLDQIARIGCSWGGTRQKAGRDRAIDGRRRTLIGARLPRETVERYRQIAQSQGISLYAWVRDALAAAAGPL